MTQTDRVLRHLQDYGSISPHEALAEYGIMRLGARIWDLKTGPKSAPVSNQLACCLLL